MEAVPEEARRRELSTFLKSRRARLRPDDVGLPPGTNRRRATGLRREEVAALAGISVNWYTLLETGRNDTISAQALMNVARALRLDGDEQRYLAALARVPIAAHDARAYAPTDALRALLDDLTHVPAVVWNRRRDALAWNAPFAAIFEYDESDDIRRRNGIWRIFNDTSRRRLWTDWEQAATRAVAALRWQFSHEPALVHSIVAELQHSPEFAERWDRTGGVSDWMHSADAPVTIRLADERAVRFRTITLAPPESGDYLVQFYVPADEAALHIMAEFAPT